MGYGKRISLVAVITMFIIQACGTAEPILANASLSASPTATPIPLAQQVTLTSITFKEEGQVPTYIISAQTPRFTGSDDARVQKFNEKAAELIQNEVEYFRKNILEQAPAMSTSTGNLFQENYTVVFQNGGVWSLKFDFTGYADGSAHPYHYSKIFNYDLEQGKKLSLENLFRPDSNYLEAVSSYCIFELSKRDIGFYGGFEQGAAPTTENYRNWNITPSGLLITFDEYQVAPYAAGTQTVLVPYEQLKSVIDPQGPLSNLIQ
jgi:hypothetical protein